MEMQKLSIAIALSVVWGGMAQATGTSDSRPGGFVGAQLQLPFGNKASKPRAALTIAPTNSHISNDGMVRTRIGKGIALSLESRAKPTLTLGIRADYALGLGSQSQADPDNKLGLSTGAAVAIGVGAALLIGGGIWLADAIHCEDGGDPCD